MCKGVDQREHEDSLDQLNEWIFRVGQVHELTKKRPSFWKGQSAMVLSDEERVLSHAISAAVQQD
jgi:hypothetical protein